MLRYNIPCCYAFNTSRPNEKQALMARYMPSKFIASSCDCVSAIRDTGCGGGDGGIGSPLSLWLMNYIVMKV